MQETRAERRLLEEDEIVFIAEGEATQGRGRFGRVCGMSGPNDRIRIACIGVRGRGRDHINAFSRIRGVEVAAVCDVDQEVLRAAGRRVQSRQGRPPLLVRDFRSLLDDPSIDAVSIAAPNHWHALMTVLACQAGKDVYVEKPCCHNVFEARQVVAAARRHGRIVQVGLQCRSSRAIQQAVRQMREGLLGDLYMARGLCFKRRESIGRTPAEGVPEGVDYNLWLGPAPSRPFTRNRFHYNWHWIWDFGNGDIGNQGAHQIDLARWGLGVRFPVRVGAMGDRFLFDDDQETPNTMVAKFEFDEGGQKKLLVFEVRHWITNREAGIGSRWSRNVIGNLYYGSEGFLEIDGYSKYQAFLGREQKKGPSGRAGGNHFENFVHAVRSRRREDLAADIEEGAASAVLIHLANISYRLGRSIPFDGVTLTCPGDEEANRMLSRECRKGFEFPKSADLG